jgi:hypothetical protein
MAKPVRWKFGCTLNMLFLQTNIAGEKRSNDSHARLNNMNRVSRTGEYRGGNLYRRMLVFLCGGAIRVVVSDAEAKTGLSLIT